jgi:hypothetical protein
LILVGLKPWQAAVVNGVRSMARSFAQKQNVPEPLGSSHIIKGADTQTAARDARQPVFHPPLRAESRDVPAPWLLAQSGDAQSHPLSRAAPRLAYDLPIISVGPQSRPAVRAKLAITAPGNESEKEADRTADRVMHMPDAVAGLTGGSGNSQPAAWANCKEGEDQEHRKVSRKESAGPSTHDNSQAPPIVREVVRSPGRPLDASTRAFMEPRFGHDFSRVRVHTDSRASQSARAIHAQAYTLGNDVVLDKRHYSPGSDAGKRLLAHELSHVLQPGSSPIIQRKSEIGDALESMLALLILYASDDLGSEILKGILASSRPVSLRGSDKEQEAQLRAHVDARKGIVDFAEKNTFAYATKDYKFNSDFWDDESDSPERAPKPGVSLKDADADLHVHPEEYALGCKQATAITMRAGSNYSEFATDENVNDYDWIPGDWGYIANSNVKPGHPGEEGQNLIYLGGGLFWGAIAGKTTRTMKEWLAQVNSWGVAQLQSWRKRPILGVSKTKP